MPTPIASATPSAVPPAASGEKAKSTSWAASDNPVQTALASLTNPKVVGAALGAGLTKKDYAKFAGEVEAALQEIKAHVPPFSAAQIREKVGALETKFNSDVRFWGNWWAKQTSNFEDNLDKTRQSLISALKEG